MTARHPDITKLVTKELDSPKRRAALDHLTGCEQCQHAYQTAIEAERILAHGDPDRPSQPELDRILRRVLATQQRPRSRVRQMLLVGLPSVAAVAGLLATLTMQDKGTFTERADPPPRSDGVRAFCQGDEATYFPEAGLLPCRRGHTLVVAVHLATRDTARAHLWYTDSAGSVHFPAEADKNGVPIRRGKTEQVLESTIDLSLDAALGKGSLNVVLCDQCDRTQARAAIRAERPGTSVHRTAVQVTAAQP